MRNDSVRKWIAVSVGLLILGGSLWSIGRMMGGQTSVTIDGWHFGIGESGRDREHYSNKGFSIDDALEPFTDMEISLANGSLTIQEGDGYHLTVSDPGVKWEYKVSKEQLILKQEEKNHIGFFSWKKANTEDVNVVLTVPKEAAFRNVMLNGGIVDMYIDGLNAQQLTFKNGVATSQLSHITVKNLDVEAGVGDFSMQGLVEETAQLKAGVGAMTLMLTGSVDDYNVDVEGGLGAVKINGEERVGMGSFRKHTSTAQRNINIQSGVGDVTVMFEQY